MNTCGIDLAVSGFVLSEGLSGNLADFGCVPDLSLHSLPTLPTLRLDSVVLDIAPHRGQPWNMSMPPKCLAKGLEQVLAGTGNSGKDKSGGRGDRMIRDLIHPPKTDAGWRRFEDDLEDHDRRIRQKRPKSPGEGDSDNSD